MWLGKKTRRGGQPFLRVTHYMWLSCFKECESIALKLMEQSHYFYSQATQFDSFDIIIKDGSGEGGRVRIVFPYKTQQSAEFALRMGVVAVAAF